MAKALFHKGQRVFVKSVGTWTTVDRVLPQWVKGCEEPLKVFYDVGLGREFAGHELVGEDAGARRRFDDDIENWRILRLRCQWEFDGADPRSPHKGTFPAIVTDTLDWGGWRVPKAEYDRDPDRIEFQARILANGLRLLRVARELAQFAEEHTNLPPALAELAARADDIVREVYHDPAFTAMDAVAAE
ncbi:MAG: hypothetical protein NW200_03690 [Hyphomonadaceae bacterium]|nr:hypothetical protein [Hyphomonadaceae bacterium]